MTIKPMAIGMLVVPMLNELILLENDGIKYPIPTPKIIAMKIQSVRYLSRKLNFLVEAILGINLGEYIG